MEIVLFAVSGISAVYYVLLVLFTDLTWVTELYWMVSALVFAFVALLLRIDRKKKQQHKKFMPLGVRTFITTTCILYFALLGMCSVWIVSQAFSAKMQSHEVDYLILIENGDVETSLNQHDYAFLDDTIDYMNAHEGTTIVLVGSSRFRDLEIDVDKLQNMMKDYLQQKGISEKRIITEEISNNLRQNIIYSYAYILVDWYGMDAERGEPTIGLAAVPTSVCRYNMIIGSLGSLKSNMDIIVFGEDVLSWPARVVEEVRLLIEYHLLDQFEYRS